MIWECFVAFAADQLSIVEEEMYPQVFKVKIGFQQLKPSRSHLHSDTKHESKSKTTE